MLVPISFFVFSTTLGLALYILIGTNTIQKLIEQSLTTLHPKISIVVSAKDEEKKIASALEHFLALTYPHMEIIFLNDRSSDKTGSILDDFARKHPRLKVMHITSLPEGWMGKNHALFKGVQAASGQYILFSDADVLIAPDTLQKAMHYLQQEKIDYLSVIPEVTSKSFGMQIMMNFFSYHFSAFFKPWKVASKDKTSFIGIGAFGLINREVYLSVGGHSALKLRPDEDLRLGQLVKLRGYKLGVLSGVGAVRVDWYDSLTEMILGMEKNAFAGMNYSFPLLIASSLVMVVFELLPFILCLFPDFFFLKLAALSWIVFSMLHGRRLNIKPWAALFYPVATVLFLFICWNSALKTLIHNGIYWRGTLYPLDQLKKNKVV